MNQGLNMWGWLSLAAAWGVILVLTIYCFSRVLLAKKKKESGLGDAGGRMQWGSRIGLILAMAGNAIGLGNFLRFPVKAAANGGGAFMIPYFCALLFLGVPLMWVEWSMGRHGGVHGHGTTPGMFSLMWKHPAAKYLGALGISLPFIIVVYYNFIESWTLGFAWFSGTGKYYGLTTRDAMGKFLRGFQGVEHNQFFSSWLPLIIFMTITIFLNYYFLRKGISKGIEVLAKIGMPVLFIFGIILAIRVLTMGTPPSGVSSVGAGMGFMWNPDFSQLSRATVWLVAAGQIFFTLSLGQGIINTYASYLREKDDVTLNGLTTSMTNEFAEVILGGTIAIPVAVAFFGVVETKLIANEGAFNLGFQALPVIFQKIPMGQILGAMWFLFRRRIQVETRKSGQYRVLRHGSLYGAGGRILQVRFSRRARFLGRHLRPGRFRHHRDHHFFLDLRRQKGLGGYAPGRRPESAENLQIHIEIRHPGLHAGGAGRLDLPGSHQQVFDEGRGKEPPSLSLGRARHVRRPDPAHRAHGLAGLAQKEEADARTIAAAIRKGPVVRSQSGWRFQTRAP
jgi:SNF family Na+-dependent transporter